MIATWLVLVVGTENTGSGGLTPGRAFQNDPSLSRRQTRVRHHHWSLGPGGTMLTLMGVALLARCRGNTARCRVGVN